MAEPKPKTPHEFLVEFAMSDLDQIEDLIVIRRYKDGCINYDSVSESRFYMYAMVCGAKAYLEAEMTGQEITRIL